MNKALLGLSIIAALSPAVASAEDFYIGGSIGQTELNLDAEDKAFVEATGASVDDSDTGFKVFAGYRAHENFAFEAFYADLGEASITDGADIITAEADSFGIAALGILPVADNFELFGKFGFHAWDADLSTNFGVSANDDGTDPMYGIGATYTMDQISFRAEIERYELDEADVDMISAGVAFNF